MGCRCYCGDSGCRCCNSVIIIIITIFPTDWKGSPICRVRESIQLVVDYFDIFTWVGGGIVSFLVAVPEMVDNNGSFVQRFHCYHAFAAREQQQLVILWTDCNDAALLDGGDASTMDTSGPTIHLHIICLTVNTVVVLVVLMVILVVGWSGVAVTFGQFRHRKFCSSSKTSSIDINGASARFSHHFAAKHGKNNLFLH